MTEIETRPRAIVVLCVLSWIYIGFLLLSGTVGLQQGPLSPEEIEDQKAQMLGMYTEEQLELMGTYVEDGIELIEIGNANYYTIAILGIVISLIGLQSTIMMFRLKKAGYYLYIGYSIAPLILAILYYPGIFLGISLVWNIVVGGIFLWLYGSKLKWMR